VKTFRRKSPEYSSRDLGTPRERVRDAARNPFGFRCDLLEREAQGQPAGRSEFCITPDIRCTPPRVEVLRLAIDLDRESRGWIGEVEPVVAIGDRHGVLPDRLW
jgi:hypothetical protein